MLETIIRRKPMKKIYYALSLLALALYFSAYSAVDATKYPVRAFLVSDVLWLSDSYVANHPNAKPLDNLLRRAKAEGYNYVYANFEPKVLVTLTSGETFIYYRYARDKNGNPVHYFKEAFEKAAKYGMIIIPNIPVFTGRDNWHGWDNLHPAGTVTYSPSNVSVNCGNKPNIQLNYVKDSDVNFNLVGCAPLADDYNASTDQENLVAHLHDFYNVIRDEFNLADFSQAYITKPAALPYVSLEMDENRVPNLWWDATGKAHGDLILALALDNTRDQAYIKAKLPTCMSQRSGSLDKGLRLTIAWMYGERIAKELKALRTSFNSTSVKLIIGGYSFDPQNGGANTYVTSYCTNGTTGTSDDYFAKNYTPPKPDGSDRRNTALFPFNASASSTLVRFRFCDPNASGDDVVGQLMACGNGLGVSNINNYVIFSPWFYDLTYTTAYPDEKTYSYDWNKTFNYFKGFNSGNGYSFISWATINSNTFQTSLPQIGDGTIQAMKSNLIALNNVSSTPKQFALGFLASWWPCYKDVVGNDDASHSHADYYAPNGTVTGSVTSTHCRCGDNGYMSSKGGLWPYYAERDYWHNSNNDIYFQPFEYNTLEYMMWFAKGNTASLPALPQNLALTCYYPPQSSGTLPIKTPFPGTKPDPNKWYKIVSPANQAYCIDISGPVYQCGQRIHLWQYYGTDNQLWQFKYVGDGYYEIRSKGNTAFGFDDPYGNLQNGVGLQLCNVLDVDNNQKWQLINLGNDRYQISPKNSVGAKFVIDLLNGTIANDGTLQLYQNWNGSNQSWLILPQ
jgi:hypothetical protein